MYLSKENVIIHISVHIIVFSLYLCQEHVLSFTLANLVRWQVVACCYVLCIFHLMFIGHLDLLLGAWLIHLCPFFFLVACLFLIIS